MNGTGGHLSPLVIDGARYHKVDDRKIPSGFAEVDVLILSTFKTQLCMMTVGLIGAQICSSGDKQKSKFGQRDTVKPLSGWWLFSKNCAE